MRAQSTPEGPLRCAGCGAEGHPPVVVHDEHQRLPGAVLTPLFGWHAGSRALLCGSCRLGLTRNRGCAPYNKPRPTQGKLTP
jgi:hypothetical protein